MAGLQDFGAVQRADRRRRRRGRVLGFVVRVIAWPISFMLLAVGLVLRLFGLAGRFVFSLGLLSRVFSARADAEEVALARARLSIYVRQAARYLLFLSDRFPPLVGSVVEAGLGRGTEGPWAEARRRLRRDRLALLSFLGILLYVYVAVFAAFGWIATDYDVGDPQADYHAPTLSLWPPAVGAHPLGTDFLGREVWKLTVHGAKNALWIGTLAAGLACVIGLTLGSIAGYFGRFTDEVIVWFYTTLASIPYLLLMLSLSFAFKSNESIRASYEGTFLYQGLGMSLGLFTIVMAVGLTFWVGVCRVVRAEFMKLRDLDYVTAARSLGIPTPRIIFRHIAPNVFHLVLIQFSLLFMSAIKFEVILSFLGVGMEEGEVSWGQMITQAKLELMRADPVWWQITAATTAMFGLLLCVNLFTDALRDALDPRLRD